MIDDRLEEPNMEQFLEMLNRPASEADDYDDEGNPIFYPRPTRFEVELDVLLKASGVDYADDGHDDDLYDQPFTRS